MLTIIKKKSKHTITTKSGKVITPMNYFIVSNEQYILIKPVNKNDYVRLDMIATYVK